MLDVCSIHYQKPTFFFRRGWEEKGNHTVNKNNSWQTTSCIYEKVDNKKN